MPRTKSTILVLSAFLIIALLDPTIVFIPSSSLMSPLAKKNLNFDPTSLHDSPDLLEQQTNNSFLTFEGFVFYSIRTNKSRSVIVRDPHGNITNHLELDSFLIPSLVLCNMTTLIIDYIGGSKTILWNFSKNTIRTLPFGSHHDIVYSNSTNSFLTLQYQYVTTNQQDYVFDSIVEYNHHGDKLWSFNFSDIIPDRLWNGDISKGSYRDMTHANSLEWDQTRGKIWVNLRNTDQIYQIDYATKGIDWVLGNEGEYQLFDHLTPVNTLFHQAHSLSVESD